jgi:hypothetical protein
VENVVKFSCPEKELSCIVGNLFAGLDPPCNNQNIEEGIVICGTTHSGKHGSLRIFKDHFLFSGDAADINVVRKSVCLERRCCNG